MRDPLNRDDIEGASIKKSTTKTRDLMNIRDIEGARPTYPNLEKEFKRRFSSMDYRDVTDKKPHVRRFSTNPLAPDYTQCENQMPISSAMKMIREQGLKT